MLSSLTRLNHQLSQLLSANFCSRLSPIIPLVSRMEKKKTEKSALNFYREKIYFTYSNLQFYIPWNCQFCFSRHWHYNPASLLVHSHHQNYSPAVKFQLVASLRIISLKDKLLPWLKIEDKTALRSVLEQHSRQSFFKILHFCAKTFFMLPK